MIMNDDQAWRCNGWVSLLLRPCWVQQLDLTCVLRWQVLFRQCLPALHVSKNTSEVGSSNVGNQYQVDTKNR